MNDETKKKMKARREEMLDEIAEQKQKLRGMLKETLQHNQALLLDWLKENEKGFISAEVIAWEPRGHRMCPVVRMETEFGVFQAVEEDGLGIDELKWEEVVVDE